ncbi:hypothetical protein GIY56_12990 [Paracoccus sp. YIM 132242]|uniref:Glycosyl hydrolase family 13 catalytic domain-containing protein n=1 Tax=Paracoccus lichenicola TaxID=2665644 RepID=A0A6L6HSJ4_9RHOB|nr:hypothetical protein [Paracoccus lichenicola]
MAPAPAGFGGLQEGLDRLADGAGGGRLEFPVPEEPRPAPVRVAPWRRGGRWRKRSAKALATAIHLMRGTPFVFQGEEIGMTNAGFTPITDYRDIGLIAMHRETLA